MLGIFHWTNLFTNNNVIPLSLLIIYIFLDSFELPLKPVNGHYWLFSCFPLRINGSTLPTNFSQLCNGGLVAEITMYLSHIFFLLHTDISLKSKKKRIFNWHPEHLNFYPILLKTVKWFGIHLQDVITVQSAVLQKLHLITKIHWNMNNFSTQKYINWSVV